jgi:putative hydrolase of the HAD superfamily
MSNLALFDLDNTLVDRQAAFLGWARRFVAYRGLDNGAVAALCELDDDGFARRERVFDAARIRYDLPESTATLIAEYRSSYPAFFEPDPAVNEALGILRAQGWHTGVVTNGPPSQLEKLVRAGLMELIDGYCISDEFGVAKPDPRIFEEAIDRCVGPGTAPTTVWMVGDSAVADIGGGRGAGLRTIWLHRGRDWEATGYRPDAVADDIRDAIERILADSQ